jgi:hypothetical protein
MQLALDPSEFAFYFRNETGIEAGDLGDFLKRTATIAKREGAELRVVGFEPGSLFVIFKAIAKTAKKTTAKVGKSFDRDPLDAAAKSVAVVGAIAAAIVWAMSPDASAPLAKAGAEVMEKHEVREINLITVNEKILVMDEGSARRVREVVRDRRERKAEARMSQIEDYRETIPRLEHDPVHRIFEGAFTQIDGKFHFRPDGFNYYVPVDFLDRADSEKIHGDGFFYRIDTYLEFRQRMPHRMMVLKVERLYV